MAAGCEVPAVILLDTCALLWLAANQDKLSVVAKAVIREYAGRLFVSSISAFEIAIKARSGKLELPMAAGTWFEKALRHHGLAEVPVNAAIACCSAGLPPLHNDPCDRIIIATALEHGMRIVTCDALIAQYEEVKVIW